MSIFFDDEAQLSGTDSGDEEDSLLSQDLDFIDLSTEDDSPSLYRAFIQLDQPARSCKHLEEESFFRRLLVRCFASGKHSSLRCQGAASDKL